jgi:uncharacterized protein YkwD
MARPTSRRSLRFESLEDRQLLTTVGPNAQTQYVLQLINMARTEPKQAAQWISKNVTPEVANTLNHFNVDVNAVKQTIASSKPLPPVAWNDDLGAAAQAHSQDMADNQYQSHTGSDGSSADDRINRSGYTNAKSTGENAYAYASSVDNAMQAFLYDWGVADAGHRRNLLQPGVSADDSFRDVGIGIVNTGGKLNGGKVGPVIVTQDFGSQPNSQAKLVGVAYSDNDGDDFYTPGEGAGNVRIDAQNLDTGKTDSTTTWNSGGYELSLAPGRYKVTASQNNVVIQDVNVTVGTVNVQQDFLLSNKWNGRSLTPAASTPAPAATPTASSTLAAKPTAAAAPVAVKPVAVASVGSSANVEKATPVSASASTSTPAPASPPKTTAAVVSTPTSPKVAYFTPADWKGSPSPTLTAPAAVAPTASSAPVAVSVSYDKPALANWTTWKANAD